MKIQMLSLLCVILTGSIYGQITERVGQKVPLETMPKKENFHIYIMAGQSNMAGRGTVTGQDKVINKRVLSINKHGDWVYAQEPLHFHEPNLVGLDCGKSFGDYMSDIVPDSIVIGVIPTAVGGSSTSQWLEDRNHRGVNLLSNFKNKVKFASQYGDIKGIIWHQGESDANRRSAPDFKEKMDYLRMMLRKAVGDDRSLPFVLGELAGFWANLKNPIAHDINADINELVDEDPFSSLVKTDDLTSKGDSLHFGSEAQRKMGKRYANEILKLTYTIDEKAIRAADQLFSQYVINGNIDGIVSSYSTSALIMPRGYDIIDKREAIRKYWTPPANSTVKTIYHRLIPQNIKVMGNFAYDVGRFEGTTLRADGSKSNWAGKYIVHWEKNKFGKWKMKHDIWNSTNVN